MRLYLAGGDSAGDYRYLDGVDNLSFLISYFYCMNGKGNQQIEYSVKNNIPMFLDCGAFSAMNIGATINLQEYIEFCKTYGMHFDKIASLDSIGDEKQTAINHKMMRDAGINSIPCYHVPEPLSALRDMLRDNDSIAIGIDIKATILRYRPKVYAWLVAAFKTIAEYRPGCKVHGFALTSPNVIRFFEWDSIDSSTWLIGRKFGNMMQPNLKPVKRVADSTTTLKHNARMMIQYVARVTTARAVTENQPK